MTQIGKKGDIFLYIFIVGSYHSLITKRSSKIPALGTALEKRLNPYIFIIKKFNYQPVNLPWNSFHIFILDFLKLLLK